MHLILLSLSFSSISSSYKKKPIQPLEDVLESEKDDYKFSFNGFLGIETKIFVFL